MQLRKITVLTSNIQKFQHLIRTSLSEKCWLCYISRKMQTPFVMGPTFRIFPISTTCNIYFLITLYLKCFSHSVIILLRMNCLISTVATACYVIIFCMLSYELKHNTASSRQKSPICVLGL